MQGPATAGVVAALAAVSAVAVGGTASASDAAGKARIPGNSIKIKGNGHPRFDAPETVLAGQDLQIVNKTDPNLIGPHSFSLVEKPALPNNRDEIKKCERLKLVCKDIANAHEVEFPPNGPPTIGKYNVENGLEGWDATFDGGQVDGDSWFTETEDETTSRAVTAGPGNLWFMCVVHPHMQDKVKVIPVR